MIRPAPRSAFEYAERGWRPGFMWVLLICIAFPFCLFVAAILAAFAFGVWRSVMTGQPMPDLLGGIDRLPWQYIVGGLGTLFAGYLARGRQVVREMEVGGGQGRPPFDESSPHSSALNPEEFSPSPAEGGPRPQENIPP